MNRLLRFLSLAFVVMLGGCTAMMESSSYGSSDLYITNNRTMVAQELTARAEAEKAEAEARKAMWEARLAEAEYYAATSGENYNSVVANDYESAYARRLNGFSSPTYRLPASYYDLATSESMRYATAYDPAFYNIMVSGDQVWVEPKYVTSMFGTWGATNVTFGIYSSPWVYGWGFYSSPFYYTMWGYPHYSWYDWNWNMCYNPYYWGYGYYPGYYYPHYHNHYHPHHPAHPPQYRPNHRPGGGSGDRFHTSERRHSSSRYTSPTSNQNYGKNLNGSRVGSAIRNSGTTSSGINNSRVVGGTTSGSSTSRYSTTSGRSTTQSSTNSGSNFRSSSQSRGTVSNSSSSSSSSSKGSSSSNYRSSGSSSSSRSSSSSSSSSSNFRSSGGSSSSSSRSSSSGSTSSRR